MAGTWSFERERREHRIKPNDQEMMPHKFAVFDTEAVTEERRGGVEQRWRLGCAVTWRNDTKRLNGPIWTDAATPVELWRAITANANTQSRLWVFAHNLGYDLRISDAFNVLPQLGWKLKKLAADRDVSRCDWTDGERTMVVVDSMTYFPVKLETIAQSLLTSKNPLPEAFDGPEVWAARCRRDVDILRRAIVCLLDWWQSHRMGNFQPSGPALGWTTWRHRHMTHKVIVHADDDALRAERRAMFVGRNEALIHGQDLPGPWTQWDMQSCYPRIAAQVELPWELAGRAEGPPRTSVAIAERKYRVLYEVDVETDVPVVPWRDSVGIAWPVGTFRTTIWDVERQAAEKAGAQLRIRRFWIYRKAPVLRSWAEWSLDRIGHGTDGAPGPVPFWIKHQSRALIGKFAGEYPVWEPLYETGDMVPDVHDAIDANTGDIGRVLQINGTVYGATKRREGDSSFPAITSVIMAEGRVRMMEAINACPQGTVAYYHTDGIWVNAEGSYNMSWHERARPDHGWRAKKTADKLTVWGPQSIIVDGEQSVAGVPKSARPTADGKWAGEQWEGFVVSMQRDGGGSVRINRQTWACNRVDTRRHPDGAPITVTDNMRGR